MPQKFTPRHAGWPRINHHHLIGLALWWRGRWADTPPGNPAFGLCFISPPDNLADAPATRAQSRRGRNSTAGRSTGTGSMAAITPARTATASTITTLW
jgi:hypothetical protein